MQVNTVGSSQKDLIMNHYAEENVQYSHMHVECDNWTNDTVRLPDICGNHG
jgi:hypothetical protein